MLELMTVVDYIGGLPVLICQDLVVGRHCRFTLIVPDAPRDHCDQGQRDDSRRQLDLGRVKGHGQREDRAGDQDGVHLDVLDGPQHDQPGGVRSLPSWMRKSPKV